MILLPTWAKAALGGALGLSLMLAAGWAYVDRERRQAAAEAVRALQDQARQDRLENIERERGRSDEIQGLDRDDLLDRLGRWIVPAE